MVLEICMTITTLKFILHALVWGIICKLMQILSNSMPPISLKMKKSTKFQEGVYTANEVSSFFGQIGTYIYQTQERHHGYH